MIALPTFVIGPENRGRGFRFLSGDRPKGSWTIDLPMALLEWAKLGRERPFTACIDLREHGLVICKAKFFKHTDIGHIAYLHGVTLSNAQFAEIDYRTDIVAAAISAPDETLSFGEQRLTVALPETIEPEGFAGLDLAWADRFIRCEDGIDRDALAVMAIRSVDPPEQRSRIRSWSTTNELPARGQIDLTSQSQLMLADSDTSVPNGYLPCDISVVKGEGGASGLKLSAGKAIRRPASYTAFKAIKSSMTEAEQKAVADKPVIWSASYLDEQPVDLARSILLGIMAPLGKKRSIELLTRLCNHANLEVATGARQAAMKLIERLGSLGSLNESSLPLLAALGSRPEMIEAIHGGRPWADLPTPLVNWTADATITALEAERSPSESELESYASIAIHFAQLFEDNDFGIEKLLTILHSWPSDSRGGIGDVLSKKLVDYLSSHDRDALPTVLQKTVDGDFLTFASFADEEHGWRRISAASRALALMEAQNG